MLIYWNSETSLECSHKPRILYFSGKRKQKTEFYMRPCLVMEMANKSV